MIRALAITHGNLGAELARVVELILGPVDGLTAGSNNGRSLPELTAHIRAWLEEEPEPAADDGTPAGAIILVDDYGGSCATAAQLACEQVPGRVVISGVNLAMVLGFLTWRDGSPVDELAERLVRKGREAITLVGGR